MAVTMTPYSLAVTNTLEDPASTNTYPAADGRMYGITRHKPLIICPPNFAGFYPDNYRRSIDGRLNHATRMDCSLRSLRL